MSEATGMGPYGPTKEILKPLVDGSPESIDARLLSIANEISNLCDDTNMIRQALERIAEALEAHLKFKDDWPEKFGPTEIGSRREKF